MKGKTDNMKRGDKKQKSDKELDFSGQRAIDRGH